MMVYSYFPAFTGGAEKQCRLQSQELVRRGYRCLVLTARTQKLLSKHEFDGGCKIVRLAVLQPFVDVLLHLKKVVSPPPSGGNLESNHTKGHQQIIENQSSRYSGIVHWINAALYIFGASIYLLRNRNAIDIIHTHIASWNAGFAGWIGNLLGIPVLCKAAYLPAFHEFNRSVPFSETWRSWRRRIRYIALTQEMAEDIEINGVPRERIHVIPNGVTISDDVTPVDSNRPVLYVGNFSQGPAHKGFDVLIKAWSKVHEVLPDAHLVIAGGGDSKPWQVLATALNCGESIRFAGHVSDMASCYRQAALFVLPSREEGISNALLEAQSFGIPAVASDIPGNREIIVHGQTGLLVPVDDVETFADAILKLIRDAGLRKVMGETARKRIIEKFSIASVVDRTCEVYSLMKSATVQQRSQSAIFTVKG